MPIIILPNSFILILKFQVEFGESNFCSGSEIKMCEEKKSDFICFLPNPKCSVLSLGCHLGCVVFMGEEAVCERSHEEEKGGRIGKVKKVCRMILHSRRLSR